MKHRFVNSSEDFKRTYDGISNLFCEPTTCRLLNKAKVTSFKDSFSDQMQNDLSFMSMGAVLEQVNSLPDSQARFIVLHRYGQLGLGERGPDMRWHVVWTFRLVLKK